MTTRQSYPSRAYEQTRQRLREVQRETVALLEARRDGMPAGADRDRLCWALDSLARGVADADDELQAAIMIAPPTEEIEPVPASP